MALGQKTKVGIEKGDLLVSKSATAIKLLYLASPTGTVYDNVFNGDEIGYFTGVQKKHTATSTIYNEVVLINSVNADGSPNFNGTKYYFDSLMPFANQANPKYNYGSSFDWGSIAKIGAGIFTILGGILGNQNANTQADPNADTNTETVVTDEPQQSWLSKNWLYLLGGGLLISGITGLAVYLSRRAKTRKLKAA